MWSLEAGTALNRKAVYDKSRVDAGSKLKDYIYSGFAAHRLATRSGVENPNRADPGVALTKSVRLPRLFY
jgi:hypothetical protein